MMSQGTDARLREETTAGNYFVSNYPPYSYWNAEAVSHAREALNGPPRTGAPLGIYTHIPFCRKRCHFCYFKVYTGKDSGEIDRYLDAVIRELTLYSTKAFIGGRKPSFIYFGGGTPSFISTRQLSHLVDAMKGLFPWDQAEEITFECEPGTITEGKLEILKQMGVTRVSLGIENFDEHILETNGRAHGAKEIETSYQFARTIGFPQINIDLIAGMMGETEQNWCECVRKTMAMLPDSVTIYQMEVPYNTTISKEMRVLGHDVAPVASWPAKRRWVDYAFRKLEEAGYTIASAYTAVRDPARTKFVYRDLLWTGADMIGLGVASFSHVSGSHFQNEPDWDPYIDRLHGGEFPIYRALATNDEERMIREFILQMKLGRVRTGYFERKFGVDVRQRFAVALGHLEDEGFLRMEADDLLLNRDGLLQVDRLLHEFFLPHHRGARYS
jgi:oxygen-independent coproporphyrinogen-3 oxidase